MKINILHQYLWTTGTVVLGRNYKNIRNWMKMKAYAFEICEKHFA